MNGLNEVDFGHFIPRHVHRDDEIVLTKLDSNAIFITYILFFSLVQPVIKNQNDHHCPKLNVNHVGFFINLVAPDWRHDIREKVGNLMNYFDM